MTAQELARKIKLAPADTREDEIELWILRYMEGLRVKSLERLFKAQELHLEDIDRIQRVLAWLGYWRDKFPPEAVSSLQDILGVPK